MAPDTVPTIAPPAAALQDTLARLDASRSFSHATRHRTLLHHLLARMLNGDTAALKESVIAVEVFGRPADHFDPVRDSIVRVEARRFRARLAAYNANEGRGAALRIELPVGSYIPQLVQAVALPANTEATRRARDLVERGENYLRQALSEANIEAALARFDAALRETPDSATACVGVARAWLNLAIGWYRDPAVASEHAAEALQRALALDPTQPLAHALLGALQNQFQRDWPAAQRSFRRGLALAPEVAFVHSAWGNHLLMRGELANAEAALARARQLDPHYINTRMHMVNLRITQGRLDDATAELAALADLAPQNMGVEGMSALLALLRQDRAAVLMHYRRAAELMPDHPACHAHVAGALALTGDLAAARETLAMVHRRFAGRVLSPYVLAIVALRMGEPEQALLALQRAAEVGDPNILQAPRDPSLAALHDDPRFVALAATLPFRRSGGGAWPAAPRRR